MTYNVKNVRQHWFWQMFTSSYDDLLLNKLQRNLNQHKIISIQENILEYMVYTKGNVDVYFHLILILHHEMA